MENALCSDTSAGENERKMRTRGGGERRSMPDRPVCHASTRVIVPSSHFHQHQNAHRYLSDLTNGPNTHILIPRSGRVKKKRRIWACFFLLSRHVQRCFSFTYSSRYLRDTRGSDLNDEPRRI